MYHMQGLQGPYKLIGAEIHRVVPEKKPGAFAVGICDARGTFIPRVAGMSSNNIAARLCQETEHHAYFKVRVTNSAKEAFNEWCFLYHLYCGDKKAALCTLEDPSHPQHPTEESWKCPVCHTR